MRKILSSSLFLVAALALIPFGVEVPVASASPTAADALTGAAPAAPLSLSFTLECLDASGGSLSECGSDPLLPACDTDWEDTCARYGGSPTGCGSACQTTDPQCKPNSGLHRPCDDAFKAACTREGGEFECDNSTCTEGTCDLP